VGRVGRGFRFIQAMLDIEDWRLEPCLANHHAVAYGRLKKRVD
jgi:hypothetical protein